AWRRKAGTIVTRLSLQEDWKRPRPPPAIYPCLVAVPADPRLDREPRRDPEPKQRPPVDGGAGPGSVDPDPGRAGSHPGRRLRPERPPARAEVLRALSRRDEAEGGHQPGAVRGRGVAPRGARPVAPGRRRPGRADHAAAGQPGGAERGPATEGG